MSFPTETVLRKNGRNLGEVFTDQGVVGYLLDEVGYCSTQDLSLVKILEPAAGQGSFAVEIVKRLFDSSLLFGFSFEKAFESNVRLVELDNGHVGRLVQTLKGLFDSIEIELDLRNSRSIVQGNFLLTGFNEKFDCVVGNPPYVRHELIDNKLKEIYRARFRTFRHRADLYVPFFEKSLQLLTKGGKLSFICSNRWMYNEYGQSLRELISIAYSLQKVLNMEKSSPFDENVIAYPSITTIVNQKGVGKTLYFETSDKKASLGSIEFSAIDSPKDGSWQNLFVNYSLNHPALSGLVNQGFEIGIGVATGADAVFIKKGGETNGIEKERLLPLITGQDLTGPEISWEEKYLLNPYDNGRPCKLDDYPNFKRHILDNRTTLSNRHTAKKNAAFWYKTIDRVKPGLLQQPKLLLPDIAGIRKLLIDEGRFYPHHNLYYVTGTPVRQLKLLAAILMSGFVRGQLSQIGIKMNGGLPRFQAQALKKLRVPIIANFDGQQSDKLIAAYDCNEVHLIDEIVVQYCSKLGVLEAPPIKD